MNSLLRKCNYATAIAPIYSSMGKSKGSLFSNNKSIINSSFQVLKYSMFHQSHTMMMNKVINNGNSTDNDIDKEKESDKSKQNAVSKVDYDEYDDYAEPVTTGQKVSELY